MRSRVCRQNGKALCRALAARPGHSLRSRGALEPWLGRTTTDRDSWICSGWQLPPRQSSVSSIPRSSTRTSPIRAIWLTISATTSAARGTTRPSGGRLRPDVVRNPFAVAARHLKRHGQIGLPCMAVHAVANNTLNACAPHLRIVLRILGLVYGHGPRSADRRSSAAAVFAVVPGEQCAGAVAVGQRRQRLARWTAGIEVHVADL